jgi:aspartyl/glutamyl-tRNA(Asn/Gln) amidotransferase C subunit
MSTSDSELFTGQIQKVLTFIDELQSVTITTTAEPVSNVNMLREDTPQTSKDAAPLELAVQKDKGYFVVPKILDEK